MAKRVIFAKMAEFLGFVYITNGCLNGLIRALILTRIVAFPPFIVITLNLIQEKLQNQPIIFAENLQK